MNSFEQFIEEFTCGDVNLQRCLQELFGCILTNNLQYKTCILLHGTGNNGKSVLTELLGLALAQNHFNEKFNMASGNFPVFTGSGNQGKSILDPCHYVMHCNDLNNINYDQLVGKKLLIADEVDDIQEIKIQIKRLIGHDSFYCQKGGQWCPFNNTAYLILTSNKDYQLVDPILARRMVKIPCLNQPEVDPHLLKKLSDVNIINEMIEWMKEGDLRVRQQGYINRV